MAHTLVAEFWDGASRPTDRAPPAHLGDAARRGRDLVQVHGLYGVDDHGPGIQARDLGEDRVQPSGTARGEAVRQHVGKQRRLGQPALSRGAPRALPRRRGRHRSQPPEPDAGRPFQQTPRRTCRGRCCSPRHPCPCAPPCCQSVLCFPRRRRRGRGAHRHPPAPPWQAVRPPVLQGVGGCGHVAG